MEHPITPPTELVQRWITESVSEHHPTVAYSLVDLLATKAARWGADHELEACCEWLPKYCPWDADQLRAARRTKPSSLKEQALEALNQADEGLNESAWQQRSDTIRQALEALPND